MNYLMYFTYVSQYIHRYVFKLNFRFIHLNDFISLNFSVKVISESENKL